MKKLPNIFFIAALLTVVFTANAQTASNNVRTPGASKVPATAQQAEKQRLADERAHKSSTIVFTAPKPAPSNAQLNNKSATTQKQQQTAVHSTKAVSTQKEAPSAKGTNPAAQNQAADAQKRSEERELHKHPASDAGKAYHNSQVKR
jgi:hypothetical protein